ncbi:MAG: hypothetical protein IJ266_00215 [Elusimicrobiaceae bacterium]|nr:hypothetical protein [Elusimicrobiaceae bacterium]
MRHFLYISLCTVALPVLAYNEIVPAISYNPSRLGSYTHLKAVEKATLGGGLKVVGEGAASERPTINIFKQVTLQDNIHALPSNGNVNNVNRITQIGDEGNNVVTKQSGGILQGKDNNSSINVKPGGTLEATNENTNSYISKFVGNPALEIDTTTLELTEDNTITVPANAANFTIGGVTINNPGWNVSKYSFEQRVDDNGTRYKILSATKQ